MLYATMVVDLAKSTRRLKSNFLSAISIVEKLYYYKQKKNIFYR